MNLQQYFGNCARQRILYIRPMCIHW